MKKTSLSHFVEEIKIQEEERVQDQYVTINLRPGNKSSAMLSVIATLTGQTPSVILNRSLSEKIAASIPMFCENYAFLLDVVESTLHEHLDIPEDSALAHAQKMGIFSINVLKK